MIHGNARVCVCVCYVSVYVSICHLFFDMQGLSWLFQSSHSQLKGICEIQPYVHTKGMCVLLDPNPLLPTAVLCCLSFGSDINFSPHTPPLLTPTCLLPSFLCTPIPEVTADSVTHIQLWHMLITYSLLQNIQYFNQKHLKYCCDSWHKKNQTSKCKSKKFQILCKCSFLCKIRQKGKAPGLPRESQPFCSVIRYAHIHEVIFFQTAPT